MQAETELKHHSQLLVAINPSNNSLFSDIQDLMLIFNHVIQIVSSPRRRRSILALALHYSPPPLACIQPPIEGP